MSSTFPKDIVDWMKECILSIFWAKKDIVDFFRNSGCTNRELISQNIYEGMTRNSIVGIYTFNKMLDRKIKAAQTMGRIYVDPLTLKDKFS